MDQQHQHQVGLVRKIESLANEQQQQAHTNLLNPHLYFNNVPGDFFVHIKIMIGTVTEDTQG